jgi:two-component system capsular synthesis sensor histidine kinase RcsC
MAWTVQRLELTATMGDASIPSQTEHLDLRLLLAEDDSAMRSLLGCELRRLGSLVVEAEDGLEALDALATAVFDAVVLDVRMPGCSGLEVLMDLRHRGSTLPVVLISGFADGIEGAGTEHQAVVLAKPFSIDALVEALRKASGLIPDEER